MRKRVWQMVGAALVASVYLVVAGCGKKKEEPAKKEPAAKPEKKPEKKPPPRKPEKPRKPETKWTKITSDKYGIEFEIPAIMQQQTDNKEYLMAWDKEGTAFIAAGAVKKVKKAEKEIAGILKALKLKLVKFQGWKDVTHNGMKGKATAADLKTAKGAAVKGEAFVFTLGKKKHVAFLLLYLAAKEKAYAPHVAKLKASIKPKGAAKKEPAKKEPAKKEPAKKEPAKKDVKKKGK